MRLAELTGTRPGVVVTDSFGRAWRNGQVDIAIGAAGMRPLDDWRGRRDRRGRELHASAIAVADAVAATADLARSKDSGEPVVIVRGPRRAMSKGADGPGAAALIASRRRRPCSVTDHRSGRCQRVLVRCPLMATC